MTYKLVFILGTFLLSSISLAETFKFLPDYEATYTITRGGKPSAVQITRFSTQASSFQLTDQTKGTHGLASMTGFNRTETTEFSIEKLNIKEIKHLMNQKVAFSKKSFQFEKQKNIITGKGKNKFTVSAESNPISAHLLPIWLSSLACSGETQIEIPVIKSKNIKYYQFKVFDESNQYYRVERQFPKNKKRSTKIWLDKNQGCFPTKTRHQEKDEPIITTQLKQVVFK